MQKSLILILVLSATIWTACNTASHSDNFLRADGHYIVNGRGDTIILRGMGLGGWMLQEGYMFGLGFIGQQYRIRDRKSVV